EPRFGGGLLRPPLLIRHSDAVSHLHLAAAGGFRLWSRRTRGLRASHDLETRRVGWLAGKNKIALDRSRANSQFVRLQRRRHAGSHYRWTLFVGASSRAESGRTSSFIVRIFLRSKLLRRSEANGQRCRSEREQGGALGSCQR